MANDNQLYNLSRSHIEFLIDEWIIGQNAERNRKIIKRRLLDGITFEKLAEEFDLTPQQIKHIVYKHTQNISKHIK